MMGEATGEVLTPAAPTSLGAADTDAIVATAGLINKARNPVLILGLLASEKNAAEAVGEFIAKTNIPTVCTYQGAGVVSREHFDRFAGRVGLFRTQPADRILDAADLVITIGYDPIEFEPGLWNRGKKRNLIHIDVVAADIDKDYRPHVELTGNIAATLRGLTSQTKSVPPAGSAKLLREVALERTAFGEKAAALNGTPIHPMRLVHELQGLLSDDMTLCLDMGSFHIWLARYLYSFRARQILMTNGQQTLGVGLP
jgi:acetolactate synthase I/II/III large subunit